LVALIVTHADAAVVLPLAALIRLIVANPGVQTKRRIHGADTVEEHWR